jgi:hypothetical protein
MKSDPRSKNGHHLRRDDRASPLLCIEVCDILADRGSIEASASQNRSAAVNRTSFPLNTPLSAVGESHSKRLIHYAVTITAADVGSGAVCKSAVSTVYRTRETLEVSERGEAGGELVASERQPRKIT